MSPETVLSVVRTLLDLVLEFVPAPKAAELLDEAARRRANAVADAAEAVKFPGGA